MKIKSLLSILILGIFIILSSCDDKDLIPAQISFDIPATGYTTHIGDTIIIEPQVKSPDKVQNLWKEGDKIICEKAELRYSSMKAGIHILTYTATNEAGKKTTSINIDVRNVDAPTIDIDIPTNGFVVKQSKELVLKAKVKSLKKCTYLWTEDGKELSKDTILTYTSDKLAKHKLIFTAKNIGGETVKEVEIEVVKMPVPVINFTNNITVFKGNIGETFTLKPTVTSEVQASFSWLLDDKEIATTKDLSYTPTKNGLTKLCLKSKNVGGESIYNIKLLVGLREANSESSMKVNKVYEYLPAPGQFVNESFPFKTMKEANTQALKWLTDETGYVTLGGFGGYVIFGFDHSIIDREEKDIMIMGNSFTGPSGCSCEPGIVSVMQDENGNGLPDDTWYELKGGNYDDPTTIKNYAVTYFRPTEPAQDVQWEDNQGNKGCIDYMADFHFQDYYYPIWQKEDSYTLTGTRLQDRTVQDLATGFWSNKPFSEGYVDNYVLQEGEKSNEIHYEKQYGGNKFELKNAIDKNGKPVELGFVDFIKVHNAVNVKAGWLGENSTEVYQVSDIITEE